MFFCNLFKGKKARVHAPKGSKKTTPRRRIWFGVEQLEDRLTPAAITLSSTTQAVFVTSYVTNAVYEFDANSGALLATPVAPNSQSILIGPAAITVGPDGNLYITGEGFGGNDTYNITEYNFSTQTLSTFISGAQLQAANGGVPFAPGGIAFGPDGNLYTDNTIHPGVDQVLRLGITNNAGQLSYNGTSTTIAILPLTLACDITFGANSGDQGNLYVSDDNSVVEIAGATTAAPTSSTFVSAGEGGLQDSCGVIWSGGNLYVTDPAGNQVLEYNASGTFLGVFTSSALQGQAPINTLFLPDGNAVTSTFGSGGTTATLNGSLKEFSSNGTFLQVLSDGAFPANPTTGVTGFTGAYMTLDTTAPATESTVVLAQDTINAPYNQSITPNGGSGAVTLSVSNVQNAIAGLNITGNGTSALSITGTPTATGTETFTVTATDSQGDSTTTNYTLTVNPAPTLSTSTLPADTINVAYNQNISASGGTGSLTLAVSKITNAIPGLSITGNGTNSISISGTPTADGTETFTVTGTDGAGGTTGPVSYSITVNPATTVNPAITLSSTTQAVFVTSYVTNAVYEFDANSGALLATPVAPNSQSILIGPAAITVGPDGNLYITGEGFGGNNTYNITEYNFSTQTLSTFISGAQLQAANGGVPFAPGGIAFGPDGNLYTDNTIHPGVDQVLRLGITNNAGQLSYNGTSTTIAILPLTLACDITFGANSGDQGNLYVSDDNSVVEIAGATTAAPTSSTFVSAGEGGLGDSCGVIWSGGNLYVTDPAGNQVLEYNASGTFLGVFTSSALQGQAPINTLFLPDGNAVTSTFGSGGTTATLNGSLKEFSSNGTFLQVLSDGAFPANPTTGVTGFTGAYMTLDTTAPATESTVVLAQDTINAPYNQSITPNGGSGAVTLSVSKVQNAIAGLNITGNGTSALSITGTPTATGTETFTVTATDSQGDSTTTNYTLTVNPAPTLSTSTLPADTVNVAYNQSISASGGTGSLTLAVNVTNAIAGLSISGNGTSSISISGTPTADGTETFTVTATDGAGGTTTTNYSITVSAAQVPTLQGKTLTVSGTPGNDTFIFTAGSTFQVSVNGVNYNYPSTAVNTIDIVGDGGQDTAILTGTGSDTAVFFPTAVSLSGTGYTVTTTNVATVEVFSGGGNSTANFGAVADSDTFVGTPTYSADLGGSLAEYAVGFAQVNAWAAGSNGTAYLATSTGNDSFGSRLGYSYVSGAAYDNQMVGFAHVDAWSGGVGSTAMVATSTGKDTYIGTPSYSSISGASYTNYAVGFAMVKAWSGGSASVAYLATSTGSDSYVATPTLSTVSGKGYSNNVTGFADVAVWAESTTATAKFTTGTSNDTFVGSSVYSEDGGNGYEDFAIGFTQVQAVAGSVNSSAQLFASAGNNTFSGSGSGFQLTGPQFTIQGSGFGNVTATSSKGGTDTLNLAALDYVFSHDANWQESSTTT